MGKYYNKVLRSKVISSGFSFCKTCSQTKPIDRFYYKYGGLYKCKQCISKQQYEYRILRGQKTLVERQAERERKTIEFNQRIETETKICPSCGENKVLTKFGVHRKTKSITSICSVCRYEKSKKSYPHVYSFEYRKTKYIKQRKKKNPTYVYKAQQIEQEQILQKGYMFCTQCKVEKPLERFEKRCRGNGFYYRACRECRNQNTRLAGVGKRYRLKRKIYFEAHPERKVEYNKKMNEYRKKYNRKSITNLSDSYVVKKIIGGSCLKTSEVGEELIEIKKLQLTLLRAIRNAPNLS